MTNDAIGRRRKYLWEKTAANLIAATCVIAGLLALASTALTVLTICISLAWGGYRDWNTPPPPDDGGLIGGPGGWTIFDLLNTFGPWLFGGLLATFILWRCLRQAHAHVLSIPYVAPLREQIASIAPAELLVRGSTRPAAKENQLLRAANGGIVASADEMLRAVPLCRSEDDHQNTVNIESWLSI